MQQAPSGIINQYAHKGQAANKGARMYLNEKQRKRFFKLHKALLGYANEQLGLFDGFDLDPHRQSFYRTAQVAARLWSTEELIDGFLAKNPYNLSKTDLATIREWRDYHITDVFVIVESDSGYCCLTGDSYSFGIIGISHEIDEVIPHVPDVVLTTLLPFEGSIIFNGFFLIPRNQNDKDDPETLLSYHHAAVAAHGLITTVEDMKQASRSIRQGREDSKWIEQIGKTLVVEGADPPKTYDLILEDALLKFVEAEHQRLLEKNEALREERKMLLVNVFSRLASHEPPHRSLEGLLEKHPKDSLLRTAKAFGLKRYSSLKKQELVELLAHHYRIEASDDLFNALIDGSDEDREFFARLVEEGGTLHIPVEDFAGETGFEELLSLIAPIPPYINLFFDQEEFTYTVPQEYVDAYTQMHPKAIESAVLLKKAILAGVYFFVETCGMIVARSYYDWFEENVFPDFGWGSFLSVLIHESYDDDSEFEVFFHKDTETLYLVHPSLTEAFYEDEYEYEDDDEYEDECGLDEELAMRLASFREFLITQHPKCKRKDYSKEEVLYGDPFKHFLGIPEAVAIAEVLDRYLPESDYGHRNTERVMYSLFLFIRWGNEPEDLTGFFKDVGLTMKAITTSGILKKASALFRETPIWEFNGWTINELNESGSQCGGKRGGQRGVNRTNASKHNSQRDAKLPKQALDEQYKRDFRVIDGGLSAQKTGAPAMGAPEEGAPEKGAPEKGTPKTSAPEKPEPIASAKAGRNEPCPCKSGKKYKHCCGKA